MEGCSHLSTINFDFKLSLETVNLCEKMPNYISAHYQERPENFANEFDQINRLRRNALNCSIDENGLKYLKRYYCQLKLLRNRFPMLSDQECSVQFTWEDAFQKEENSYNDIRFEESCILYNIGVMYSRLGTNEPRKTHESVKNTCTYFRYAAACFEKLRDQYMLYALDCTPDLLACQTDILLGQAHEAVLEKSILDQRPPTVNASIAMQISEYYQKALVSIMQPGINSILSKKFREWRVALTYKSCYYLSLTYYYCAFEAQENKRQGEAVCYFENSVEKLKEGWKSCEKISSDKLSIFKDAHAFTCDLFNGKYKTAKHDNDHVYFEKVPALSSLPAVRGAIVAKSQFFDCHDADVCGVDVFQKLIPMDTHLAASEYSEEKAKLLREIVDLIANKNQDLENFMNCLQLDQIPLNNEYRRLPRELLDCCASLANRSNISNDLISFIEKLDKQHSDVSESVNNFSQLLETFENNNESIKLNKNYQDLKDNIKTIEELLLQANTSNTELHRHVKILLENIKILNSPIEQIEKTLPIITELDDEINQTKFSRIELLIQKVETMKTQREALLNDIRQKVNEDDITKLVLMHRQENHKNLFSEQIKKYDEITQLIQQNCSAQDNILHALTEANAEIADIRTNMMNTFQARRQLIRQYISSFQSLDDTISKTNEGIEFYKKQITKLNELNERFASLQIEHKQQQQQQQQTTLNIQSSSQDTVSNQDVNVSNQIDRPRLKDYLAAMKPDTWGSTVNRSAATAAENIYKPSPLPNVTHNNNHLYSELVPPSAPHIANITPQNFASLPNYNQQQNYMTESRMQYEQAPNYLPHQSVPYNQPYFYSQNLNNQPQMMHNPSNVQAYSQNQSLPYVPPQTVYQNSKATVANSSMYNYDSIRPIQQSLPSTQYDPYRPQPVGTYDIPKAQPLAASMPPPLMNPQDVYRPGGLLGINQSQMVPSVVGNNDHQYMQYIPSSLANLSINSITNH